MDDKRYYYNKNYGMLKLALQGMPFDERYYIRLDYLEAMEFIIDNFKTIIGLQLKNYNSTYFLNKENLKHLRKSFLESIGNDER